MTLKVLVTGAQGFVGSNLVLALRRGGLDVAAIDIRDDGDALLAGLRESRWCSIWPVSTGRCTTPSSSPATSGRWKPHWRRSTNPLQGTPGSRGRWSCWPRPCRPHLRQPVRPVEAGGRAAARRLRDAHRFQRGHLSPSGNLRQVVPPNYNSVATFCHNIARDLPIVVSDPNHVIELVHVDDVVARMVTHVEARARRALRAGKSAPSLPSASASWLTGSGIFAPCGTRCWWPMRADPLTATARASTRRTSARRPGLSPGAAHRRPRHAGGA